MKEEILIVGAGITGLSAAMELKKLGKSFKILEASDIVGGRVKTNTIDEYKLDLGFQVLLTSYPAARQLLNYDQLKLQHFDPGALILLPKGEISLIGDPLRQISSTIPTLSSSIGSLSDKWKVYRLSKRLQKDSIESIHSKDETTTLNYLQSIGFSKKFIDSFFRPFFSGIFLESELQTSSRMFEFVFKMFSDGYAAIPENGMGAIPLQMEKAIGEENILLNHRVRTIGESSLEVENGDIFHAEKILICTEQNHLTEPFIEKRVNYVSTTNLHFLADQKPYDKKLIALNSSPTKLFNNLCVLDSISPSYANGRHLISISSVGLANGLKVGDLIGQLESWFPSASDWELLDRTDIKIALPDQSSVTQYSAALERGNLYYCGDILSQGSLNACMRSGIEAAKQLTKSLK